MKQIHSIKDLSQTSRDVSYKRTRNLYNHLIASQADMIDVCLADSFTFAEILQQCDISAVRLKSHLRHLLNEQKLDIRVDENSRLSFACAFAERESNRALREAHKSTVDADALKKAHARTLRVLRNLKKKKNVA